MPAPIRQLNVGEAAKDNRVKVAVQAAVCSRVRDISYAGVRFRDMGMRLERAVGLVVACPSCYHAHRETLRKCNPRSCPFDTMRPSFMWSSSLSTTVLPNPAISLPLQKIRPRKVGVVESIAAKGRRTRNTALPPHKNKCLVL